MKHEKSCGAVLFTEEDGNRLYLILHSTLGHYTLCKGHVEEGETEEETAAREIMEETGMTARFQPGFRKMISYSPKPDTSKDVVFFLARLEAGTLRPQPEEVQEIFLLPVHRACNILTHASDREVLMQADGFLNT